MKTKGEEGPLSKIDKSIKLSLKVVVNYFEKWKYPLDEKIRSFLISNFNNISKCKEFKHKNTYKSAS